MNITLEQLQELVIKPEDMKEIAQIQEDKLTYAATMELMADIAKARPIAPEEKKGLAPIDRIGYLVRNAYIVGYINGVDTLNEAIKGFIADFAGGGTDSLYPLQAVTEPYSVREGALR